MNAAPSQLGHAVWASQTSQGVPVIARRVYADQLPVFQKLQTLALPCLPSFYFVGVDSQGDPCVIEEMVRGVSLEHLIAMGPVKHARALARATAESLHDLHCAGILHLDLKPAHVVFTEVNSVNPRATLLDLEFAMDTSRPRTTCLGWTPRYASPEQLGQGVIGPATDLRALGLILAEMLIGQHPFEDQIQGLSEADIAHVVAHGSIRASGTDPLATLAAYLSDPDPRLRPGWDFVWSVLKDAPERPR